jgi:hypothetical protein
MIYMFDKVVVLAECANLYNCPKDGSIEATTKVLVESAGPAFQFEFYDFVSNFNYFALAWTMFYSFVLMTNFFYWRIISHRERLHHEAKGVKSIQDIVKFWWRYIITLFIFTFVSIYRENIGVAAILLFVYALFYMRMFWFDTYNLFESLSESFDQIAWKNNWPKKVKDSMKNASLGGAFKKK